MEKEKVGEDRFGLMEASTKDIGAMICRMDLEGLFIQMVIVLKESGAQTKPMEKGTITLLLEIDTVASG